MAKYFLIKRFDEYIRQLLIGTNMLKIDVSFSNMISNEMMTNFNMLRSRMLHVIVSNIYSTLIVMVERYILHVDAVILEGLLNP